MWPLAPALGSAVLELSGQMIASSASLSSWDEQAVTGSRGATLGVHLTVLWRRLLLAAASGVSGLQWEERLGGRSWKARKLGQEEGENP